MPKCWGKEILSISARAYLIDTQLLLPSLKDVTLSSSWIPVLGIPAVLLSSRSKTKYYFTRCNSDCSSKQCLCEKVSK